MNRVFCLAHLRTVLGGISTGVCSKHIYIFRNMDKQKDEENNKTLKKPQRSMYIIQLSINFFFYENL